MIAIIVITAAFIVLLSVFNGFEGLVKSLYSTFYTDIRVVPTEGRRITVTPSQLQQMKAIPGLQNYSLVVEEKALLQNGDVQTIVYLKGVDESYSKITEVPSKMVRGEFNLGTQEDPSIVLGSGIESALSVQSDRSIYPITAYLFKPGVSVNVVDPIQAFSVENLSPAGSFFIQQDIDNKYALTNVYFMKYMLGMKENEFGSVEIKLSSEEEEASVKKKLENLFGPAYTVETRYEQNKSLYSVMRLEKWAIYGILTLMLVVAAFTMVGALTMLVLEKQKDIQVLKAMGAPDEMVQKIFLSEGLLLAGIGTATGLLLAIGICWAQVQFKLVSIQGGTFLIDYYPVQMVAGDFVLVVCTVLLIAIGASWFPSRKAALQPVELRT